jgi:hypothetical protein
LTWRRWLAAAYDLHHCRAGPSSPNPPRDMKEPGSLHQPGLCFMPPEPTADFCPCPAVPNPMRRRCGTGQTANWTRHVRSWCDLHSPLPANALPEGSQRVGMDPRDQARWLPAHCPGRTAQSRGPPDSAETAQAFPRTVYLESCYGTQCSPRSLFSHSIILAAYALAKTPAGDRVNVRNALP